MDSNAKIYLTFFKIQNLNQNRSKIQNWFGIMVQYYKFIFKAWYLSL